MIKIKILTTLYLITVLNFKYIDFVRLRAVDKDGDAIVNMFNPHSCLNSNNELVKCEDSTAFRLNCITKEEERDSKKTPNKKRLIKSIYCFIQKQSSLEYLVYDINENNYLSLKDAHLIESNNTDNLILSWKLTKISSSNIPIYEIKGILKNIDMNSYLVFDKDKKVADLSDKKMTLDYGGWEFVDYNDNKKIYNIWDELTKKILV